MKINVILWGTGRIASRFEHFIDYEKVVIEAYADNDRHMWGKQRICKKNEKPIVPVIGPDDVIDHIKKDTLIIIVSSFYSDIKYQLGVMQISSDKIIDGYHIEGDKYDIRLENILRSDYFEGKPYLELDGFKLNPGIGHSLQKYKREHLMYDAFVPYLAMLEENMAKKCGSADHWIIDIGANIGDTTLGMIKHTSAGIIAVEPTESFYLLLNENINAIDTQYSHRVKTIQAYISDNENEKYQSIEMNGTAVKTLAEISNVPTISIINLIRKYNINWDDVKLIKIDTDGYDADCIISCGELLKENAPILYWENAIENNDQYKKYMECCGYLEKYAYTCYFVFDNFGNYMGRVDNHAMKNINGYLARINNYWGTRTFYYVDVLACKEKDRENVESMIEQYLRNYPNERYCDQKI